VTGHSFHTLAPVPQPSTTHAPEMVEWHPGPQPSAAAARLMPKRITANNTANVLMRRSFRSRNPRQYSQNPNAGAKIPASRWVAKLTRRGIHVGVRKPRSPAGISLEFRVELKARQEQNPRQWATSGGIVLA
jgi:hypothetical protein